VDVEPVDAALAAESLLDGGVEDADGAGGDAGGGADVAADAVAADQADDGVVGDVPAAVGADGDAGAGTGRGELLERRGRHRRQSPWYNRGGTNGVCAVKHRENGRDGPCS